MANILRYFAEFGSFRGQLHRSGWLAVDLLIVSWEMSWSTPTKHDGLAVLFALAELLVSKFAVFWNTVIRFDESNMAVSRRVFMWAGLSSRSPRVGLTTVPVVPWEGAPDQLPNFYHDVWTFERVQCRLKLNITATTKKGQLFRGKKRTPREQSKCARPEQILVTRMRKGPPPYVGMGPPNC